MLQNKHDCVGCESSHIYRPDIDGMRAVAILLVVGFHAFPQWIAGGFIGVDIFFVISGFLISSIILTDVTNDNFSYVNFYSRRINRIFPALLLVLISSFIIGWFLLIPHIYKELGKHIAAGASFLSNFVLWRESSYFDVTAESKPLLHLWSLSIEEQFYLCWPALLIVAWKVKKWDGILGIILTIITISFLFSIALQTTAEAFYSPLARFWELIIGGLLAYTAINNHNIKNLNIKSIVGMLLLIGGLLFINKSRIFPGWWVLLPVLGTCLIISAGSSAWINKTILSNKLMVWIGLISYPLYLWHWLLLSFARIVENGKPSMKLTFILIALSIILAALTYYFIEKPFRAKAYRKIKAVVLLTLMLVVGCVGYYSYTTNWTDIRLPPELRTRESFSQLLKQWSTFVRSGQCYITDEKSKTRHDICYESQRPSVALWGDSHAASLYPGLKSIQHQQGMGIIQLTQSGCPPIFDLEKLVLRANCNDINKDILDTLIKLKPDVLILHAAWKINHYELSNEELRSKFSHTLHLIKNSFPNTKIVVIGPVPQWEISPRQVTYWNWRKNGALPLPIMQKAVTLDDIDSILNEVSDKEDVIFISAINILCNDQGCISRVGDKESDYITWDYGHLTKSGSELFIQKIKNILF